MISVIRSASNFGTRLPKNTKCMLCSTFQSGILKMLILARLISCCDNWKRSIPLSAIVVDAFFNRNFRLMILISCCFYSVQIITEEIARAWVSTVFVKFIYSEKANKFCEISNVDLSYPTYVHSASQIYGGDFAKFCGLLRIYEL